MNRETRDRPFRIPLRVALGALLLASGGLVAGQAHATSFAFDPGPSPVTIETICEGDCGSLPLVATDGGEPFDFEYGARLESSGLLDLFVESSGNVFLLGPFAFDPAATVWLRGSEIRIRNSIIEVGRIELETGVDVGTLPPLVPPPPSLPPPPGGSGIIVSAGGLVTSTASDGPADADCASSACYQRTIAREGDIYLDVTGVVFSRLKVWAGGAILLDEDPSLRAVPEPGVALLLGLGLAVLGARRRAAPRS